MFACFDCGANAGKFYFTKKFQTEIKLHQRFATGKRDTAAGDAVERTVFRNLMDDIVCVFAFPAAFQGA